MTSKAKMRLQSCDADYEASVESDGDDRICSVENGEDGSAIILSNQSCLNEDNNHMMESSFGGEGGDNTAPVEHTNTYTNEDYEPQKPQVLADDN